jgi:hypothetical protein
LPSHWRIPTIGGGGEEEKISINAYYQSFDAIERKRGDLSEWRSLGGEALGHGTCNDHDGSITSSR